MFLKTSAMIQLCIDICHILIIQAVLHDYAILLMIRHDNISNMIGITEEIALVDGNHFQVWILIGL
jgi:hypothetical protein